MRDLLTAGLERLMGVEPTSEAWEASILPMNYSRINTSSICVALLFYHKLPAVASLFLQKKFFFISVIITLHNLYISPPLPFRKNYSIPHFPLSFPHERAAFSPISSYFSTAL